MIGCRFLIQSSLKDVQKMCQSCLKVVSILIQSCLEDESKMCAFLFEVFSFSAQIVMLKNESNILFCLTKGVIYRYDNNCLRILKTT